MLEKTDHQHALVACQDLLRPVAMMNVEIDDCDRDNPCADSAWRRGRSDVVEEAAPIAEALRA